MATAGSVGTLSDESCRRVDRKIGLASARRPNGSINNTLNQNMHVYELTMPRCSISYYHGGAIDAGCCCMMHRMRNLRERIG